MSIDFMSFLQNDIEKMKWGNWDSGHLSSPTHSYANLPPLYFHSGIPGAAHTKASQALHIQKPALVAGWPWAADFISLSFNFLTELFRLRDYVVSGT